MEALARATGLSLPTISYVEQGRMIPTPEELEKVFAALAAKR